MTITRLADEMGVTLFSNRLGSYAAKLAARLSESPLGRFISVPKLVLGGLLKKAKLPGCKKMSEEHPHGLLLPENEGGNFLGTERVLTKDGRVDLAPAAYMAEFLKSAERLYKSEIANAHRMKLIGKREMRRLNTFSCNSEMLVKDPTNFVYMSPDDAARLGVAIDDRVEVVSAFGKIEIPVRITDEMMPRTVAIPQCWGHAKADGLAHAQKHPGVNSNYLAGDGRANIERLSGMSHLSGILVDIRRVESRSDLH